MSEKCGNVLEEEGQRLLCQLPEGHSKHIPHESGDWEWWDVSAGRKPRFYYEEDQHGNPTLFWVNPWNGNTEPIANFFWPTHEPSKTRLVEEFYELMGAKCADAAAVAWLEVYKMEEAGEVGNGE